MKGSDGCLADQNPRYVFDITELVPIAHRDARRMSGIPRTVLLLTYYAHRLRPETVTIGYFDAVNQRYVALEDPTLLVKFDDLIREISCSVDFVKSVNSWKYKNSKIKRSFHDAVRRMNLTWKVLAGLFNTRKPSKILNLSEFDCLVCLGGAWNLLDLYAFIERNYAGSKKMRISALIHDMIPVKMEIKGTVKGAQFKHSLREMLHLDPGILVYSNSTMNDVQEWCEKSGNNHIVTKKFSLADELGVLDGTTVRDEVHALSKKPFVLMVGPLTGRKNAGRLLQAWKLVAEKISSTIDLPLLVFAGSEGREVLAECGIAEGDLPRNDLRFVVCPNDLELQCLYENCLFTVYPSLYEGWGLPIGESLWHGKVCATSNRSSMPEAGGNYCDYFDPESVNDIAGVLYSLVSDRGYLESRTQTINKTKLKTWLQASQSLLDALDAFGAPPMADGLSPTQCSILRIAESR